MIKPIIQIFDSTTGEEVFREMNAAEYEKYLADKAITEANTTEAEAKAVARQEILDKLGLTADEAKLLLG